MHTLHFRRLGFKSRREGLVIRKKNELRRVSRAILNERAVRPWLLAPDIERTTLHEFMVEKNPGFACDSEGSSINYSLAPGKWARHKAPVIPTKWHEELHLLFGQVAGRYGEYARRRLVANIVMSVPSNHREDVARFIEYVGMSYNAVRNPMRDIHEEVITNLFNFLNSKYDRKRMAKKLGMNPVELRQKHARLRDVGRFIQTAAEVATPNWLFVYRPWAVRAALQPGDQMTFALGPGAQVGPWARRVHW